MYTQSIKAHCSIHPAVGEEQAVYDFKRRENVISHPETAPKTLKPIKLRLTFPGL